MSAKALAKEIEGKVVALKIKCGENGKTFGSVTGKEVSEGLEKIGIKLDKKKIELKETIKATGKYSVTAKVYPGVSAQFFVVVESL